MMDSKTGRPNRVRTAVFCSVLLMTGFATVQSVSAKSAKSARPAGWLATGVGVGGAYVALKNNLLKRLPDTLDKATGGFVEGDASKVHEASSEVDGVAADIVTDAFPVLGVVETTVEKAKEVAKSVKRKVGSFVDRAKEAAVDARVALTGLGREDGVAREIFDPEPLPEVKAFSRRKPVPASPWDAKGPATVAKGSPWAAQGPAAAKTDPWAKSAWDPPPAPKGKPASPAKSSSFRKWVEAEQRSRPNCYGVVSEDCDGDYREALSRMTGEAKGGYQEQVTALEAREKARLAAEKAERERLEAERRARELAERQEAERRARELAERQETERREAEREARELARMRAKAKRETEARTRRMLRNALQNMQNVGRQIEQRRRENERQAARARIEQERARAKAEKERERREYEARKAAYRSCIDALKRDQNSWRLNYAHVENQKSQGIQACRENRTFSWRGNEEETRCFEKWRAYVSNWEQANPSPNELRCQSLSPASGYGKR